MDISRLVQPHSTASKTDPADVIMWLPPPPSSSSQAHPRQEQTTTTTCQTSNAPAFPGPLLVVDSANNSDRRRSLLPAAHTRTALLLIDIQRGLNTSHGYYGTDRSTPTLEGNVATLLGRCREYNANANAHARAADVDSTGNYPIQIIHVFHQSNNPASPLHVSGRTQKDGMEFMPCAAPDEPSSSAFETVLGKTANSAFADGGRLQSLLAAKKVGQLVVVGIATDHCVSSSVRWAKDLGVVKRNWDRVSHGDGGGGGAANGEAEMQVEMEMDNEGTIVVVRDATACFGKGGVGAEVVQRVSLASLEGEFADVLSTADVLGDLVG
ncbi:hypothetical protein A1O7_04336 [Cladophialophora yegresii CBS 114405]|uniref:Isochorismatase-like domain-containing protein n=1 Tax=Cladophialophora yegresii CBS 114405 TaxID=1182544 RepID=W9WP40_9EURO|nr:uncharacterized protein A1O7_04336 [Cladophialophora yegresii CBS 114405]EXJ60184.1 hypothetical protein A1O7_04336 [Cladophialophora yegresii CBS 114405]